MSVGAGGLQAAQVVPIAPFAAAPVEEDDAFAVRAPFSCSFPPPLQRLQLPRGARQKGKSEQKMGVVAHSLRGFERSVASAPE